MPRILRFNAIRPVLILLFWFVMVLLRVIHLDSDAYARLSWSSALLTDEGFYLHNARNLVLFGHMRTDDFNNALIMPLLHIVQVAVFTLCGVGAMQSRSISVVSSLLTLLVFFAALRRAFGVRVAWLGLVLLGLDPVFVLYNRLALMDTPACLPLVCAFYAWTVAHRKKEEKEKIEGDKETRRQGEKENKPQNNSEGRAAEPARKQTDTVAYFASPCLLVSLSPCLPLFLCGLCLGAAYATRGLAAIVVPVPFLLLLQQAFVQGGSKALWWHLRPLLAFCGGLSLALLIYALVWYWPHHAEIARLNAYYTRVQLLPHSGREWKENLTRGVFARYRGTMPFLLKHSPMLVLLAAYRFAPASERKGERWQALGSELSSELYLRGWLLLILALTLNVNYAPSRYYVLFYPPLAALAALQAERLWNGLRERLWADTAERKAGWGLFARLSKHRIRIAAWLLLMGWGAGNLYWFGDWLLHLSYRQRDADRWLAAHLPADSVLMGALAPGLCLDNHFRCVNVIEHLCNDVRPVEKAAPAPRYIILLDRVDAEPGEVEEKSKGKGETDKTGHGLASTPATVLQEKWRNRWKEPYWQRTYPELVRPERRLKAFTHLIRPFFTVGVYPVPADYSGRQRGSGKGSGGK